MLVEGRYGHVVDGLRALPRSHSYRTYIVGSSPFTFYLDWGLAVFLGSILNEPIKKCLPVPEGPCGGPSRIPWLIVISDHNSFLKYHVPSGLRQKIASSIAPLTISVLGSHTVWIYLWDGSTQ